MRFLEIFSIDSNKLSNLMKSFIDSGKKVENFKKLIMSFFLLFWYYIILPNFQNPEKIITEIENCRIFSFRKKENKITENVYSRDFKKLILKLPNLKIPGIIKFSKIVFKLTKGENKFLNFESRPRKLNNITIKYYLFAILKFINLLFSGIWKFGILLFSGFWNFGNLKIRFFKISGIRNFANKDFG